ncbi:MAG: hypothetical protein ACK5IB_04365 [Qingshengfaniella sp.]
MDKGVLDIGFGKHWRNRCPALSHQPGPSDPLTGPARPRHVSIAHLLRSAAAIVVLALPAQAATLPAEDTRPATAVFPNSEAKWWPRADFMGGPCILDGDLEKAFSKGSRLPRTCIERPCEDLLTLKRMDREVFGRAPEEAEVKRYNSAWVYRCMVENHDEDWGPLQFYELFANALGPVKQMVATNHWPEPGTTLPYTQDGSTTWTGGWTPFNWGGGGGGGGGGSSPPRPKGGKPGGGHPPPHKLPPEEIDPPIANPLPPLPPGPDRPITPPSPPLAQVPLPATGMLLGGALVAGLALHRRRRRATDG